MNYQDLDKALDDAAYEKFELGHQGGSMSQSSEQGAPELLPCPFAHTPQQIAQLQNPTPYVSDGFNEDGYWQVICPVCLAATACCEIKANAIERWNTRTRSDICASARREAFDEAIAIARKMGIAWGVDATDSDDPEPWLNHERAAHRIEQSLIDARDTTPKEMEK